YHLLQTGENLKHGAAGRHVISVRPGRLLHSDGWAMDCAVGPCIRLSFSLGNVSSLPSTEDGIPRGIEHTIWDLQSMSIGLWSYISRTSERRGERSHPRDLSPLPSSGYMPPTLSGRALARAALGREFPLSALSIAERVPSPTIAHVSSRPP